MAIPLPAAFDLRNKTSTTTKPVLPHRSEDRTPPRMQFCGPQLFRLSRSSSKSTVASTTCQAARYTVSRDPSLDLREAGNSANVTFSSNSIKSDGTITVHSAPLTTSSLPPNLNKLKRRSTVAGSHPRTWHQKSASIDPAALDHHGDGSTFRGAKRKRAFSVASIESLMKKAHTMLMRRSSVGSFASVFVDANRAAEMLDAEANERDHEAEAAGETQPDEVAEVQGSEGGKRDSLLRHKRNVSDLHKRYSIGHSVVQSAQQYSNLAVEGEGDDAKRYSRVVSEDGDSAWFTDAEDDDDGE
jgi:hypothetical protein